MYYLSQSKFLVKEMEKSSRMEYINHTKPKLSGVEILVKKIGQPLPSSSPAFSQAFTANSFR